MQECLLQLQNKNKITMSKRIFDKLLEELRTLLRKKSTSNEQIKIFLLLNPIFSFTKLCIQKHKAK